MGYTNEYDTAQIESAAKTIGMLGLSYNDADSHLGKVALLTAKENTDALVAYFTDPGFSLVATSWSLELLEAPLVRVYENATDTQKAAIRSYFKKRGDAAKIQMMKYNQTLENLK